MTNLALSIDDTIKPGKRFTFLATGESAEVLEVRENIAGTISTVIVGMRDKFDLVKEHEYTRGDFIQAFGTIEKKKD